jgi:hypothetical protein
VPFADDLLEQSKHLATRERKKPRQASLRRAVSTAYYALFHLLIDEATRNWKRTGQRAQLARLFEHGQMKAASDKRRAECERFLNANPPTAPGATLVCMSHLHIVAHTFCRAQQRRHIADYDNAAPWTRTKALGMIDEVDAAFHSWRAIREDPAAQSCRLALLGTPKG